MKIPQLIAMSIVAGAAVILLLSQNAGAQFHSVALSDKVGVATVDITPEKPIRLSGYGSRTAPSEGVEQKLFAKALCFQNKSILLTVDTIGVPARVTKRVHDELSKSIGIKREDFVICSTHSHTAPTLHGTLPYMFPSGLSDEEKAVIKDYTDDLIEKLVAVSEEAYESPQAARVSWGKGKLTFAANRRVIEDGKWKGFGVQKDGPVDHSFPMMKIEDADKKLIAIFANYACHCTTLGGNFNRVHGDWAGVAQEEIEKRHPGATALIAIGCGADQNPEPRGELDMAVAHGKAVADEVDRLLGGKLTRLCLPVYGKYNEIRLPLDPPPFKSHWEKQVRETSKGHHFAKSILNKLENGEDLESEISYPIQTWTFYRELTMVFLAGEVVVDYAHRFYSEYDENRLWINAYSNDVPCYIPSRRILKEGGYEADYSMVYYGKPARLVTNTEDRIVTEVAQQIYEDFRLEKNGLVGATPGGDFRLEAEKGLGEGPHLEFDKAERVWRKITNNDSVTWTANYMSAGKYSIYVDGELNSAEFFHESPISRLQVGDQTILGEIGKGKTGKMRVASPSAGKKFGKFTMPRDLRNVQIRFHHDQPLRHMSIREVMIYFESHLR